MLNICLFCSKKLSKYRIYKLFCDIKCKEKFLIIDIKNHPYTLNNIQ